MQFNTDGIILKVQQTGEADRIVTILSREKGIIRAFARGAKRPKNPLHSGTALFCYGNLSIYQRKDTYNVNEVQLIEIFYGLRDSVSKLALAHYFCELATVFCPEGDRAEEQLRLTLNSLHMLEKERRPQLMLKAIMELRLMTSAGYMPNLVGCDNCGRHESPSMFFGLREGKLFCDNCIPTRDSISLPLLIINAMRHIAYSEIESLYKFSLPDEVYKLLSSVTEKFMETWISHRFSSLDFYRQSQYDKI